VVEDAAPHIVESLLPDPLQHVRLDNLQGTVKNECGSYDGGEKKHLVPLVACNGSINGMAEKPGTQWTKCGDDQRDCHRTDKMGQVGSNVGNQPEENSPVTSGRGGTGIGHTRCSRG